MTVLESARKYTARLNPNFISITIFIVCIVIIYWQVSQFQFISLDDPLYVEKNAHVQEGLSGESILWAFSLSKQGELTNWHPLTWLSHMVDYQLFGLNPGMHHISNVFFHAINVILLYLVLMWMTGSIWKSVFVALLFAVHPVNVDSVAWVSERKNLLSTTFWLLTMMAYLFYTRKPDLIRYLIVVLAFCMGSLAKPMLVTLPFVLLLIDYWPLHRIELPHSQSLKQQWRPFYRDALRLVLEKVPLFVMSSIFIFATMLSLRYSGTLKASQITPMDMKIKNAIVSYLLYMGKMIWPTDLTVFYPFPDSIPLWQVMGSMTIIVTVTAAAIMTIRKYPYIIVGWLWFLGTLVPVIGIIQAGLWPAIAERWAYIPYIGLFIVGAWGGADAVQGMRNRKLVASFTAISIVLILTIMAWRQTGYWKNDFTLFSHSIKVDPDNYVAHVNLGNDYAKQKDSGKAIFHYQEALRIHPNDVLALNNLGHLFNELGEKEKSIWYYSETLRYSPDNADAHYELGSIYAEIGKLDEAMNHFSSVVRIDPSNARAYYNLGVVSVKKGDPGTAVQYFSSAVKLSPEDPEARCSFGLALMNSGRINDAIKQFNMVLMVHPDSQDAKGYRELALKYQERIRSDILKLEKVYIEQPEDSGVLLKLAMHYVAIGDNEKALEALYKLIKLKPDNPDLYYNVACIYARQGKLEEAIKWLKMSLNKGFRNWDLLRNDMDLENIRNSSFYQKLMIKENISMD